MSKKYIGLCPKCDYISFEEVEEDETLYYISCENCGRSIENIEVVNNIREFKFNRGRKVDLTKTEMSFLIKSYLKKLEHHVSHAIQEFNGAWSRYDELDEESGDEFAVDGNEILHTICETAVRIQDITSDYWRFEIAKNEEETINGKDE